MAATNVQAFSGDLDIAGAITSNLEVGTANLFVDTLTGSVGIGLTTQDATFEVQGPDMNGEDDGTSQVISRFSAGHDGILNIFAIQTGNGEETLGLQTQIDGRAFETDVADGWNYATDTRYDFVLQPYKGNVGIGTTNPGKKLVVADESGETEMLVGGFATNSNASIFLTETPANNYGAVLRYSGTGSPQGFRVGHIENQGTLAREDFAIDRTTGNVGIGTTDIGSSFKLFVASGSVPSGYPFGLSAVNNNRSRYYSYTFTGTNNATAVQSRNFVVGGAERIGFLRIHKAGAASGSGNVQDPRSATFMFCPYGFGVRSSLQFNYGGSAVQIQNTGAFNGFRVRVTGAGSYHQNWLEIYHPAGIYW